MNRLAYRLAVRAAESSPSRFKVGSCIYRGSKILGVGFNDMGRVHPRSPHEFLAVHAEFAAALSAAQSAGEKLTHYSEFLRGSSIYTHRLKKDGSVGLAAPCEYCRKFLLGLGIRRINYSREE